jgi:predicted NBD/HSP70 family sugar kinase
MKVLALDIGGNSVKVLATGKTEPRKLPSGPTLTPRQMVSGVLKVTEDWEYDAVSVGYPGRVRDDQIVSEPANLGPGWVRFDFAKAFGVPVQVLNDAAMQALGSYQGGTMLFLGLGTGLGSALIVDDVIVPMELGHLPYKTGTYESHLGIRGLERLGIRKWREGVNTVITQFIDALEVDDVVIGGGNANKLEQLPRGCRMGNNAHAFAGGYLLWTRDRRRGAHVPPKASAPSRKN